MKIFIYTLLFVLLFSVFSFMLNGVFSEKIPIKVEKTQIKESQESLELELITYDLHTYGYISDSMIDKLVIYLGRASSKYNIPVGLLHAIIRIESDYKWWIEHKTIIVKHKKTNAIGLGGIVWEYWEDSLKANNIAQQKSDLFLPRNNINAIGFILKSIIEKMKNIKEWNILDKIITRYYGKLDKSYKQKMLIYTSDLYMKRMSIIIKKSFNRSFNEKAKVHPIFASK